MGRQRGGEVAIKAKRVCRLVLPGVCPCSGFRGGIVYCLSPGAPCVHSTARSCACAWGVRTSAHPLQNGPGPADHLQPCLLRGPPTGQTPLCSPLPCVHSTGTFSVQLCQSAHGLCAECRAVRCPRAADFSKTGPWRQWPRWRAGAGPGRWKVGSCKGCGARLQGSPRPARRETAQTGQQLQCGDGPRPLQMTASAPHGTRGLDKQETNPTDGNTHTIQTSAGHLLLARAAHFTWGGEGSTRCGPRPTCQGEGGGG